MGNTLQHVSRQQWMGERRCSLLAVGLRMQAQRRRAAVPNRQLGG